MAFLRAERKKSGTYLRIIQSYRQDGKIKHKTLHSLGKKEDYTDDQLEKIAKKLMDLAGRDISSINSNGLRELGRYNYGYALVLNNLWSLFNLPKLAKQLNAKSRIQFDWEGVVKLMMAERINEPCSKRRSSFNQSEYLGFSDEEIPLHHFYRTLDFLSTHQEQIKKHLFKQQQSLFSQSLDVVFYDVTTLYFDSQKEDEGALRQKGYSKDGKAHKLQVVLGLMVDKARNPISYQIYQGNTYEGKTMVDALKNMRAQFNIDKVIVVADSAMIDKQNRTFMADNKIDYIIGDSIKVLGKGITDKLLDKSLHRGVTKASEDTFTYCEQQYKGRRIICTYSTKRARKDKHQREVLIQKAKAWLEEPSKYKNVKKRGAGRFISTNEEGAPLKLDVERIKKDARYDGFKALSTTTDLPVTEIISKYTDLFEVEHTFRALKSQLEIRPVFHWTDKRIEGHICICFMAFTFFNYLRNITELQYSGVQKTIDMMQMSLLEDTDSNTRYYLKSNTTDEQKILIAKLKLKTPPDTNPQGTINQYFT